MKIFNLKRMLGLLAIGGAVAYARSKKIDILGKLGLRRGASPDQPSQQPTAAAGLSHDKRPETSTPGVGAPRNYAGFGSSSNGPGGYNRPR